VDLTRFVAHVERRGMRTNGWTLSTVMVLVVLALTLIGLGCGDDDGDDGNGGDATTLAEEAAALQEEIAGLSDEDQIKRVGAAWAEPFAAGDEEACGYMHPDIVPSLAACSQFLEGALTGSTRLQRTYEGATVTDVTVMGETATTRFSNGESVEFQKDPDGNWKIIEASRAK
jgi:hypothetical protein